MSLRKRDPCFDHILSVSWLPYESLHEFWHVFTNVLVLTLVHGPWGFELLETIYQFSLMFLSYVTLSWHDFSRTCFDSHSRSHFAYAFRQYDWGIFLSLICLMSWPKSHPGYVLCPLLAPLSLYPLLLICASYHSLWLNDYLTLKPGLAKDFILMHRVLIGN